MKRITEYVGLTTPMKHITEYVGFTTPMKHITVEVRAEKRNMLV